MAQSGLRFHNKVAIVTGDCQGIGRGIAEVFVENGGKVAVLDIQDNIGNTMSVDGPGELFYVHCDVTNEAEVKTAVQTVIDKYGQLDCLINNAGITGGHQSLDHSSLDDFRKLLEVNLVAYYSTIKGGITALGKGLAIAEAKNGVRINTVSPGAIMTPLFEEFFKTASEEERQQWISTNENLHNAQMKRIGDRREIGHVCLYFATDATFCTGTDLLCTVGAEIGYGVKMQ